jgi:hypothetical protein
MMIDLTTATGEELAGLLSDYQFELLLRARCRAQIAALEHATGGTSYHNSVSFRHDRDGGKWTVNAGGSYSTTHSADGEVLGKVAEIVLVHERMVGGTKLAQLAAPATAAEETTEPPVAIEPDEELPF